MKENKLNEEIQRLRLELEERDLVVEELKQEVYELKQEVRYKEEVIMRLEVENNQLLYDLEFNR